MRCVLVDTKMDIATESTVEAYFRELRNQTWSDAQKRLLMPKAGSLHNASDLYLRELREGLVRWIAHVDRSLEGRTQAPVPDFGTLFGKW